MGSARDLPPPKRSPMELPAVSGWKKLETERSGLLVLLRHIARPERGRRATVLAVTDVFGGWGVMGRIDSNALAVSLR